MNKFILSLAALAFVACGDSVTVISGGGPYTGAEDAGQDSDKRITEADSSVEKDSAIEDSGTSASDAQPDVVSSSCTTGYVRCNAGMPQECVASAWKDIGGSCQVACSAAEGVFTIDHSQLPPAPASIVRKSGSKILLTQVLTSPMTFAQAEFYCQNQFGQGWRLVNGEPLAVSNNGCNPTVDHAAFPNIAVDTEVWSSTGIGEGARVFSFKLNDSFPAPDANPRRVMCVRLIP